MDYFSAQSTANLFDREHKCFLNYIERKNRTTITTIDEQEFYRACFNGDFESASILLKLGINLNKRFDHARTLIHIACIRNFYGLVKLLIKFGCNEYIKDSYSRTALHYAAMQGSDAIVHYLVERNTFDLNKTNDNFYLKDSIELSKEFLNHKDIYGKTALYYACEKNNLKCVEYILEKNRSNNLVDVNASDEINGQSALDVSYEKQYWDVFELLIKYGANISGSILREICSKGNVTVINILLRYTNNCNNNDKNNKITNIFNSSSSFMTPSKSTNTNVVRRVNLAKIDWHQIDENNNTPIYFAFKYSFNVDFIRRLLEADVFPSMNDIRDFVDHIKELKFDTTAANTQNVKSHQEKLSIYIEYLILLLKTGYFTKKICYSSEDEIAKTIVSLIETIYTLYQRSDSQTQSKLNYRIIYMFALAIYSKQLNLSDEHVSKWLIKIQKQTKIKALHELFNDSKKFPWSLQMLCRCTIRNSISVRDLKTNNTHLPYICFKYLQFEYI